MPPQVEPNSEMNDVLYDVRGGGVNSERDFLLVVALLVIHACHQTLVVTLQGQDSHQKRIQNIQQRTTIGWLRNRWTAISPPHNQPRLPSNPLRPGHGGLL